MATFGDSVERQQTGVPFDMVHVYIHEIEPAKTVVCIVQTDGVANKRTLGDCGRHAWSARSAAHYLQGIPTPRDDMSVAMLVSEPVIKR